jgi:inorganic triphosphatase YgiF
VSGDCPDLAPLLLIRDLGKFVKAIEGRLFPVFVTDIRRTTRLYTSKTTPWWKPHSDEGTIKAGPKSEVVSELELELKGRLPGTDVPACNQVTAPRANVDLD